MGTIGGGGLRGRRNYRGRWSEREKEEKCLNYQVAWED